MSRKRTFPLFPFMTVPGENTSPFSRLSQSTQDSLLKLAKIFLEIDRAIFYEAQMSKYFRQELPTYPTTKLFEYFKRDVASVNMKYPDELWKTLSVDRIGKYNPIWNEAAVALLQYQAGSRFSDLPAWSIAKSRALPILNLCSDAWEVYDFEEELEQHNYRELLRGIRGKFRSLHGFLSVYNVQPAKGGEPLYNRPLSPPKRKKNAPVSFSQAQQNRNATLVSIVFTATTLCLIPLFLASHHSTSGNGSSQDAGFYLLIQNAIM